MNCLQFAFNYHFIWFLFHFYRRRIPLPDFSSICYTIRSFLLNPKFFSEKKQQKCSTLHRYCHVNDYLNYAKLTNHWWVLATGVRSDCINVHQMVQMLVYMLYIHILVCMNAHPYVFGYSFSGMNEKHTNRREKNNQRRHIRHNTATATITAATAAAAARAAFTINNNINTWIVSSTDSTR